MADKKISDLPDGVAPVADDYFVVDRSATTNVKLAWSALSGTGGGGGTQTAISGLANSETTYTSGTVKLSELGAVTIRSTTGQQFQFSVDPQSVQTQSRFNLTLDGNSTSAGAGFALVSSGALTLAGGNNITLSQDGNAITISGVSIPAESQTFIGAIQASNTTYTSGSVVFTGSGAATVKSGTGQQVIIDVPAQSVQPETQTFIAGVSASDTLYTSGNVRLTGVGGGVTVGSNTGQRIDISVAAPVAQTAQTGISGIANSQTTYTSGTVSLSELGAITIRSTTGNQFQFSVNAQSVQPETQTFIGGIQNSETTYTSGSVKLSVNGGNMTIRSTTGNAFQFSISQSVQAETQTFLGGLANSETTYTSGSVTLSALANITIRSTTGQQFQFSVPSGATATGNINAISNSDATYTSGTIGLSALTNITIRSTTGNQFQFSVAAQSVQPETQTFIAGIQNSETTYTSGSVKLSVVGGNMTIRSTTGQAFQFSVSQSVQAETQTFLGGLAASNTTYTSGTMTITGVGGGVTVSSNTGQRIDISVAAPVAQTNQSAIKALGVSNTGTTLGNTGVSTGIDWVIAASGNVTASQSTSAGGPNTVWISVPAQSVQPETQTFIAGIQNSETTYSSGSVKLSVVGGNMTIRSTTGQAFQFSISQSVQAETQTAISGIANSETTYTSGTVSLSGLANITIRSTTGNQFQFSVNSQTVQTQSFLSAGMSTNGNTSGDTAFVTGRLALIGGNNITLSGSTNAGSMSLTISAPNLGAGAFSGGASTLGNTAGSTGITGTQLVFVGTGPISLSQSTGANGGTLSINAPATSSLSATGAVSISTNGSTISIGAPTQTNQAGSVYAVGNSTGTSSGTYDARTLSISGAGMVSVAASNSGYVISATQSTLANIVGSSGILISSNASSITIYQNPISNMEVNSNFFYSSSSSAIANTFVSVVRLIAREIVSFTRVDIPMVISLATSGASHTAAHSISKVMNIYTRNGSTLNAVTGTSQTEVFSWASNSANFANLTGPRLMSFPLATALTPGEYYIGYYLSTVTFSSVGAANTTSLGGTYGPLIATGPQTATMWAQFGSATNATSSPVSFMQGVQSVSLSATNNTIQASNITQSGTAGARAAQILLFRG